MISPDDLAAIRARHAAATPGPWRRQFAVVVTADTYRGIANCELSPRMSPEQQAANAEFIIGAISDIPALLSHIAELEDECCADAKLMKDEHMRWIGLHSDACNERDALKVRVAELEERLAKADALADLAYANGAQFALTASADGLTSTQIEERLAFSRSEARKALLARAALNPIAEETKG